MVELLILSGAIFLVARMLPGIYIKNGFTAVWTALVYSLVNFFLGWVFLVVSFPAIVLTLGLFKLVVNGALLWITDKLVPDFEIRDFPTTILAALLITLVDRGITWIF